MSSELTGKAVYVVSSGIQMIDSDGEVESNPVELFSTAEQARVYMRELAKQLFWDRLKDGWSGKDGYDTPSDDDFSCDGHFQEEGQDYISFSNKPSYRLTDDDSDTGYVSMDIMYIDQAVKEETAEANDSNKKRKLVDDNALFVGAPQPQVVMPPLAAIPFAPSLPPALSTTTPMPPQMDSMHHDLGHTQASHISALNMPDSNVSYSQGNANAHNHFDPYASYLPASCSAPNSSSNPIVVADSPSKPGDQNDS